MNKNKKTGFLLNPLIEARRNFSVIENRIFYLGLQDVNPHISENDKFYDTEFPDTFISSSDLKKMFGHGQYFVEIKKACKRLMGILIEINFNGGFEFYTLYQHIRYKDGQGLFIKFNEDMKPFILNIYEYYKTYGFTKIEMQQIFILNSAYAMRLLELLLQYNGKKKNGVITRKINIDELREKLAVPIDAYKKMKDFRKNVLDLPITEIEKKTKYIITYETIKQGRKIVAIEFKLNCNAVKSDNEYTETVESDENTIETQLERDGQTKLFDSPTADEPTAPAIPGLTEGQQDLIDRLINRGVSAETAEMLVKKYPPDVISSNLKHAVQQKDTARNLPGLIIKFIENDTAGNQEKAKMEAKERQKKKDKEKRMAYGIIEEKIEEKIEEEKIDLENISPDFKKFLKVKKGGK